MAEKDRARVTEKATWALAVALLAGVAFTMRSAHEVDGLAAPLATASAPRRLISLELVRSCTEVGRITGEWHDHRLASPDRNAVDAARDALDADDRLVVAYSLTFAIAAFLALWRAGAPWWAVGLAVAAALVAGVCDLRENGGIREMLLHPGDVAACRAGALAARTRTFAQVKFTLLLGVGIATLVGFGTWLRNWMTGGWRRTETGPSRTFADLIVKETCGIFAKNRAGSCDLPELGMGPSGEPWVIRRPADLFGLALSGGGIRSATFNLGFLQGLSQLRLLGLVDYLSTVSGGGYLGAFWSAWLVRGGKCDPGDMCFPHPAEGMSSRSEPAEIRHLREFSGFLSARIGFFEKESWQAVVSVLAGLLPAAFAALSVLGLCLVAWLALTFFLACPDAWAATLVAIALTIVAIDLFEHWWMGGAALDGADTKASTRVYRRCAGVALGLVGFGELALVSVYARFGGPWPILNGTWKTAANGDGAYDAWWRLVGLGIDGDAWFASPRLFDFTLVWFGVATVLLLLRMGVTVALRTRDLHRIGIPAYDRVIMRLLGAGVMWAALALLWHVSVNFRMAGRALGATTVLSAGTFALLRNWFSVALRPKASAGLLDSLKPYVPQILAYLTVALAFSGVGALLIDVAGTDWFSWWAASGAMAVGVAVIFFVDPAEFGMHGFYRDRICRAYLGATNTVSGKNRQTDLRMHDDLGLTRLPRSPLHLVCCAANDLNGDPIETLSRGARSAVLSKYGISVGNHVAKARTSLGGAVTASAAAFNSNMGSVSMSAGPAVTFLMTALNLRLGLWARNPGHATGAVLALPGMLFYREMFGRTDAGQYRPEIHLSDGGHFENLALYELVRRHCRYVIVSDCGEDVDVAFDDFGNASRRIRDDFGVDIDIDLRPLRPEDGWSRQHVAVGTIHYSDFDKGILVYVKPTLTGDEPPDVLQYRTRNLRFPHEPTTDQFYDEAQWESYRRLGEHTAMTELGFVRRWNGPGDLPSDWVFTTARQERYPTPASLPERALAMTARFGTVEAKLRKTAASMLDEVFPELAAVEARDERGQVEGPKRATDEAASLTCIIEITQVMEDVYTACELDTLWEHPLNMGWMNCFARWVTSPTFRTWWPIIEPMYSGEFGRFLRERYPVLTHETGKGVHWERKLTPLKTAPTDDSLAWKWWTDRSAANPAPDPNDRVFGFDLVRSNGSADVRLQVALAIVRVDGATASWTSDRFYVPPSLWGAGIGGGFMDELIKYLEEHGVTTCNVEVRMPRGSDDAGARADRVGFIEFYKRHRFRLMKELPGTQTEGRGVRLQWKRPLT